MSNNNNAGAKSTNQSDENTSHTIAKSNYPVPDARPYQSRHTLEEEICAKLLNEVKKDVGLILNKIEEVEIMNEKLRGEHGKLKSENTNLSAEIEDLKLRRKKI
jgi:hypothetical protein